MEAKAIASKHAWPRCCRPRAGQRRGSPAKRATTPAGLGHGQKPGGLGTRPRGCAGAPASQPGRGWKGRRLVARTLVRRYACRFDEATRPYQFALQARAGTDCLAALLRAATKLDPAATVVSLDGRCAYDSVSQAAFLDKLAEVTPSLVPLVRAFYGAAIGVLVVGRYRRLPPHPTGRWL